MLKSLQQKWKVSGWQFFTILLVFAITGTTTAFLSKAFPGWLGFNDQTPAVWKWLLRIGILLIGYQLILLSVAFLLGQFAFFWQFEKKLLQRLHIMKTEGITDNSFSTSHTKHTIHKLAIFASGAGSNAQQIINHFQNTPIQVALIVCNKPEAGVIAIAQKEGIPLLQIEKEPFFRGDAYLPRLQEAGISMIILAGFLWKVPEVLIHAFPRRIINIHPALLPKYGGKGMYGAKVHGAVIEGGEKETGITIHYVDEHYDNGDIIFQATCPVEPGDTPGTLAQRVHALEHQHFPAVIERLIMETTNSNNT
jgi:formyltetrahydrofolate-dependent phosphoribosylglycinamide formyltransferase